MDEGEIGQHLAIERAKLHVQTTAIGDGTHPRHMGELREGDMIGGATSDDEDREQGQLVDPKFLQVQLAKRDGEWTP